MNFNDIENIKDLSVAISKHFIGMKNTNRCEYVQTILYILLNRIHISWDYIWK